MSKRNGLRRYVAAVLVVCFGIGASWALFISVRGRERDRVRFNFEAVAGDLAAAITTEITENTDTLRAIRSFFDASPSLDRAQFQVIAQAALSRNPSLHALEWAPRVRASEREAYEAAGRHETHAGFQFTERRPQATMVRAAPRPEYAPVYFVEPLKGNEVALGFDLASNPLRREGLERARDTGEPAATARIRLVQETGEQSGFLIVLPVYRSGAAARSPDERRHALRGHVLGVFRIGGLVAAALKGLTVHDVTFRIDDETTPGPATPLLVRAPNESGPMNADAEGDGAATGLQWRTKVNVAGRRWSLTFRPTAHYVAAHSTGHEWSLLTAGLLVTGLVGTFLVISAERAAGLSTINAQLEREVGDRTRAEEIAERGRRESEIIADLARTINASLDLQTVLQKIAEGAKDLCACDGAALALRDGASDAVVLRYSAGHDFSRIADVQIEPGQGVAGQVLLSGRPFRTEDYGSDSRITKDFVPIMADLGIVTMLGVPISAHGRIEGVLFASNRVPRPFTERDEAILSRLADQAAVAIQNAQLHGELREKLAQTETLLRVGQDLTGTLDATEMMRRVAKTAGQALGADMAGAFFADAEQRSLRPIAGYHVPPHLLADFMTSAIPIKGHRILEEAWERRQPVWSSDAEADTRVDRSVLQRFPQRAALFCPMVMQGAPIGGLFLTWFEHEHRFTPAEVQLIEGISRQAGVALANARLVEELKTRHGRLEALLEVSRQLSRIQPLPSLLESIAEVCGQLLDSGSVGIRLVEGDELVLAGAWGDAKQMMAQRPLKIGESGSGHVAASREALVIADPQNDPRLIPEYRERLGERSYRAWLGVPITMGERLVGVLNICTKRAEGFGADDLAIATAFASQAAVTLENTRLYQEVKRAYDELSQTQDQLMQAQKMEAVGRLAGGVAHDFNNLLTVITGHSYLLLQDLAAADPMRSKIELIRATANRAAGLTRQLLAFSRKQVLERTVLDLPAVVTGLTSMLQRLIGEDVELAIVTSPGTGRVFADRGQLEQVLANLVVNARDAMPQGGRLTIHTARVELDEAFTARYPEVPPGTYAMLTVSDTGTGMSPEIQARMFEPFFTTKEVGKGTGLGLSTVYGIVRQHEGWIAVESEPGRGSTFKIYLPQTAEADEPPKSAPAPVLTPGGVETILVAEDEAEVRALACEALAMKGYTVLEAPNGGEAVRIAAERISPIHLLVTDVVMPGLNGREVAARVRRSHPEARILYMSGYTDDALVPHNLRDLALVFLAKPFTPHGLARKVREVLDALAPREKPSSELDSETGAGRYAATRGCSNGWSS